MSKYVVIHTVKYDDNIFGKIFKKKTIEYYIRNTRTGCKINIYSNMTKEGILKHCEYLNKYDAAEEYIICKDGNGMYHVMYKTTGSQNIIVDGVDYNYISYISPFHEYDNIEKGCRSFEEAEVLRDKADKMCKERENRKVLKVVKQ